jgi:HEAT repeat protein
MDYATNNEPHPTGLQRMQQDRRSTAELVETAIADAELKDDQPENHHAIAILHARGTRDVLQAALDLCAADDPKRRALGANILGQLGSPERTFPEECCDALLDLLRQDHDLGVLISAVFALGHLGNRRCEPDLVALRNHPDEEVRHGVAFSLCGTENPASVQALLELMEDPYEMARDWSTTSIGQTVSIDGPEIRAALLRRANDSDEITRAEALHGLARRLDERVRPCLIGEVLAKREKAHLFHEAAKTFLGLGEELEIGPEELLAALQSGRPI